MTATRAGLVALILAPVIWTLHFAAIYGLHGLACGRGIMAGWIGWVIVLATILAAAALAAVTWPTLRHARRGDESAPSFLNHVGLLTCIIVAVALAWNTLPVLLVPACGGPVGLEPILLGELGAR